MCGRFTITFERDTAQQYLQLEIPTDFIPRYNVAPTQQVAVWRDTTSRSLEWMRWGLIPSWAKDTSIGVHLINARGETLLEKPSFREAFQRRRCLILADGFFEWQKQPGKQPSIPYYFTLNDKKLFFFAGLWDTWHSPSGETFTTCAIITTTPNAVVEPVHDRMPVLFESQAAWAWLNKSASASSLQAMLLPYPAEKMNGYVVSTLINQANLETPELIKKI